MLSRLRKFARPVYALKEFSYAYVRFFKYAGWRLSPSDKDVRNFHLVKIYHALEKSLSFRSRKVGSGRAHANMLVDVLEAAKAEPRGFHDEQAIYVLDEYLRTELAQGAVVEQGLAARAASLIGSSVRSDVRHGVQDFLLSSFSAGTLSDPSAFFESRRSLREYSSTRVSEEVVNEAVRLAMRSPSVCNRQAWHVYYLAGKNTVQKALSFQDGNRGFGHKLEQLLIVTVDQRAFVSSRENYQHWIDGGMFSMSLVWAMHALGIASCCLNWSQSGKTDKALRKSIEIDPHHSVMMMISFGYPEESNVVCKSPRRPVSEILTKIDIVSELAL